jgi:hypothetical protein
MDKCEVCMNACGICGEDTMDIESWVKECRRKQDMSSIYEVAHAYATVFMNESMHRDRLVDYTPETSLICHDHHVSFRFFDGLTDMDYNDYYDGLYEGLYDKDLPNFMNNFRYIYVLFEAYNDGQCRDTIFNDGVVSKYFSVHDVERLKDPAYMAKEFTSGRTMYDIIDNIQTQDITAQQYVDLTSE